MKGNQKEEDGVVAGGGEVDVKKEKEEWDKKKKDWERNIQIRKPESARFHNSAL